MRSNSTSKCCYSNLWSFTRETVVKVLLHLEQGSSSESAHLQIERRPLYLHRLIIHLRSFASSTTSSSCCSRRCDWLIFLLYCCTCYETLPRGSTSNFEVSCWFVFTGVVVFSSVVLSTRGTLLWIFSPYVLKWVCRFKFDLHIDLGPLLASFRSIFAFRERVGAYTGEYLSISIVWSRGQISSVPQPRSLLKLRKCSVWSISFR